MNITNKGDIYGWRGCSAFGFRNHIRPAHNDFGSIGFNDSSVLDNVRTSMGESGSSSNLRAIQLPFSKNQFKETKQ